MARSREAKLGKLWVQRELAQGNWAQKLPASSTAGIPDYLHVGALFGSRRISLIEAKGTEGDSAFHATMLTGAQIWTLDAIVLHGGSAGVLVLHEDGFIIWPWVYGKRRGPLNLTQFRRLMTPWT